MKHLKSFEIFNESYSTRANFKIDEPVHLPHSENVYGYMARIDGSVTDSEFSSLMVSKLAVLKPTRDQKESTRWSTYNAIKIALDYWDAISDEEWLEVDEEFKQRVVENSENPTNAIKRFLKRDDNLSDELLRLKSKVEGFIHEDKGFFRRLKERFRK